MPGRVEIEDVADALDVEPARRDVRRDENIDRPRLESVELGDAARLVHVAMDLAGLVPITLQRFRQFANPRLAIAEVDRGVDILGLVQVAQRIALSALRRLERTSRV